MIYLQIIAGLALLLAGAELLVSGAVTVARRLGISPLVVGMTVVAFGTSAPELVVGLRAALADAPGIALGNVVGSNIANVLLILGGAGLVKPILIRDQAFHRDAAVLIGASLLFAGLCWRGVVGVWSGALLLAVFLAFLAYAYWRETRGGDGAARLYAREARETGILAGPAWRGWAALALGIAGVVFGAEILVAGGVAVARTAGVSEAVIGLTLFAVGTSLPELAVSIRAAARGHADVALGNIVGSNLFNVLGIAGAVAVVAPLPVPDQIRVFDLWVMLGATLLLVPYLLGHRRLGRVEGAAILAAYGAYIAAQAYGVSNLFAALG